MQFTTSLLALAALSTSVLAGPHHRHFHKRAPMPDVFEALSGASPVAHAAAATTTAAAAPAASSATYSTGTSGGSIDKATSVCSGLGIKPATNAQASNGNIWHGSDGPYTNKFVNSASEDVTLVVWGKDGSWVNANAPAIAITLSPGASTTVSFANGVSCGWAGIYKGTTLVNGQIAQTWGELTTNGQWTTFDVSREVNMGGKSMKIETPNCTSDMSKCVFVCTTGQNSCWLANEYTLQNCAAGSQPGAGAGTYGGAASGGCMGMGTTAALTTTFS